MTNYKVITMNKKYINDNPYLAHTEIDGITYTCPLNDTWQAMTKRCYGGIAGYENTSICTEWRTYSNFRKWMIDQHWEGNEIDKDVLVAGNRHYSPDTCAFITRRLNNLFRYVHGMRGDLPLGVHYEKERPNKPYSVRIRTWESKKRVGRYATIAEAQSAYLNAKADYIYEVAAKESDPRVLPAVVHRLPEIRLGTDPCYTYRTVGGQ